LIFTPLCVITGPDFSDPGISMELPWRADSQLSMFIQTEKPLRQQWWDAAEFFKHSIAGQHRSVAYPPVAVNRIGVAASTRKIRPRNPEG